jgi:alginate O-acetyltransferase complex protein AlgI
VSKTDPLRFALFVSFFPQLIAGPISHHAEILPQLRRRVRVLAGNVAAGLSLFAVGLFKKVVIADGVSPITDLGFAAVAKGEYLVPEAAWASALAYTLQLYFDFSGYSDMACGLGLMFGIRLPVNFLSPYKSTSIIEFWRRWHITLSRFLRDYLYIPLGGNRRGPRRRWLNLFITMILGGLWHGAGWTFVLWGTYHGILLMANHVLRSMVPKVRIPNLLLVLITFLAVVVGWVFFRADSLVSASIMLKSLFMLGPAKVDAFSPAAIDWAKIVTALIIVWGLPNTYQVFATAQPALGDLPRATWLAWQPTVFWAALIGSAAAIAMLPSKEPLAFLYFQF